MNVFIAVPKTAPSNAVDRIAFRLQSYGHTCYNATHEGWLGADLLDPDQCDAVVLGEGWDECPFCCNVRHNAVSNNKIIAYESDLSGLDPSSLRDKASGLRREYRIMQNDEGVNVQVQGFFGFWHTVKTFRDPSDPAYARLLAEELMDKLTDY